MVAERLRSIREISEENVLQNLLSNDIALLVLITACWNCLSVLACWSA